MSSSGPPWSLWPACGVSGWGATPRPAGTHLFGRSYVPSAHAPFLSGSVPGQRHEVQSGAWGALGHIWKVGSPGVAGLGRTRVWLFAAGGLKGTRGQELSEPPGQATPGNARPRRRRGLKCSSASRASPGLVIVYPPAAAPLGLGVERDKCGLRFHFSPRYSPRPWRGREARSPGHSPSFLEPGG